MPQVNVTINGRHFRMACEEGQEDHLRQLAKELDERIVGLRGQFGEIGDIRLTVMAALTVADELAETVRRLRKAEEEISGLRSAHVVAADENSASQVAMVTAFHHAAERIESLARKLNQRATPSEGVAQG